MRGKFITFEGSEGSGKSTQAKLCCSYLRSKKKSVLHIREPGGVKISEQIRRILLNVKNTKMSKECETLLYMAARAQLVKEIIAPALAKGKIVICDRFLDSTVAYQGYGCGVSVKAIKKIGRFATLGLKPHLTFVFDIKTKEGLSRTGRIKDRIERRSLDYHNRVRRGYLNMARLEPRRIKIIKVDGTKKEIRQIVQNHLKRSLGL